MTDLTSTGASIPSRLGTTVELVDDRLVGRLEPRAETAVAGMFRASVVAFLVDAVAGLEVDTDPDVWTFTSDLSVRLPPATAPAGGVAARPMTLRSGRRSVTTAVELTAVDAAGTEIGPFGHATASFARVDRRPGDPDKPSFDLTQLAELWKDIPRLDVPVVEAAGVEVVDAGAGVVALEIRDDLRNPAGALQGAMVALVAEVAAERAAAAAIGAPRVVTELELRYLAQGRVGPVRTRTRFIGPPQEGSLYVELVDDGGDGRLLTVAYARAVAPPA